jgi:hypothetical protein
MSPNVPWFFDEARLERIAPGLSELYRCSGLVVGLQTTPSVEKQRSAFLLLAPSSGWVRVRIEDHGIMSSCLALIMRRFHNTPQAWTVELSCFLAARFYSYFSRSHDGTD